MTPKSLPVGMSDTAPNGKVDDASTPGPRPGQMAHEVAVGGGPSHGGNRVLSELDDRLLAAHRANDLSALSALYQEAADLAESLGDIDRACFFLTHAWVFALETGSGAAAALRKRLVAHGRHDSGVGED